MSPSDDRRAREEQHFCARRLGYPCMVRPSYVLGGRAMEIVYSDADLKRYIQNAVEVQLPPFIPSPLLSVLAPIRELVRLCGRLLACRCVQLPIWTQTYCLQHGADFWLAGP